MWLLIYIRYRFSMRGEIYSNGGLCTDERHSKNKPSPFLEGRLRRWLKLFRVEEIVVRFNR